MSRFKVLSEIPAAIRERRVGAVPPPRSRTRRGSVTAAASIARIVALANPDEECMAPGPGKSILTFYINMAKALSTIMNFRTHIEIYSGEEDVKAEFGAVKDPARDINRDKDGLTLTGVICIFKWEGRTVGHAVPFVRIQGLWYRADNERGFLEKKLLAKEPPTFETKYSGQLPSTIIQYWIPGLEDVPAVFQKSQLYNDYHGRITFKQLVYNERSKPEAHPVYGRSATACYTDALQSLYLYADGYSKNMSIVVARVKETLSELLMAESPNIYDKWGNAIYAELSGILPRGSVSEESYKRVLTFLTTMLVRIYSWEKEYDTPYFTHVAGATGLHPIGWTAGARKLGARKLGTRKRRRVNEEA